MSEPGKPIEQPAGLCGGVISRVTVRTMRECTRCGRYRYPPPPDGIKPEMRQRHDGSWHCPNKVGT
jgi:hypothetical protein